MKNRDEFYIGYLPKAPPRYARAVVFAVSLIAGVLIIAGFGIGYFQRPFNPGYFEFGELTELKGVLYKSPVPRLLMYEDDNMPTTVLLVGAGKAGALGTIEAMENVLGDVLNGREVVLQGTLIYGEGKVLMELTAHEHSLVSASDNWIDPSNPILVDSLTLDGEIIDPKCYFGVMKPGNGVTHSACAIRCVSGGIPPVLRVAQNDAPPKFYLLRGPNGERINKRLLSFIGGRVSVRGQHRRFEDWDVLDIDTFSDDMLSVSRVRGEMLN